MPNYQRAGLQFPSSIVQNDPDYVRVYFGLERSITFHAPGFTIVDRPALDRHLAERATKSGAEIRTSNYVSKIERKNGGWRVSVRTSDGASEVNSEVLICADGHGTLLRHIGIEPPKEIITCMQYEVNTVRSEKSIIDAYLSPELAPGGYGWLVPSGDGKAKIGVGVRNSPKPCMYYMQNLLGYGLRDSGEIVERMSGIVQTSGVIKRNFEDGLMIVGGAAGYVNPFTGAGIVSGYWSGKMAGQAAVTGFRRHDLSKAGLAEFRNSSHSMLDEPLDKTLALRVAYDRLGRGDFEGLYRLVDKYAITNGFKRRRMLKAAVRAVIQHPNLAGFFIRFARARDALIL